MKLGRIFSVLSTTVVIGMLTTSIALADDSASKNAPSKQSLVALGDSIAFGYNLGVNNHHPSKDAFPYIVGSDENFRVRDLGVPGWTSSDLLQALESSKFEQALRHSDAVLLDIGNNDLLQVAKPIIQKAMSNPSYQPTPPELMELNETARLAIVQFQTNLPKIIEKIREQTSAPIVVFNLYNPFPEGHTLKPIASSLILPMNGIIAQTAGSYETILTANAHGAFEGQEMILVRLADNDIHPTLEGQKILADLAKQALDNYYADRE
jgi:lysophospholipase L1-like esterase